MTQVRIIGIGSPFGDDRIGWDAIDALDASGLLKRFPAGSVDACCCDRPGGGLLMLFKGIRAAIVIDAMKSGFALGAVRKLAARELEPDQAVVSSHGVSVAESIGLGRILDLLPSTLLLYGVEVACATPEAGRHPDVRAAIPVLLRAIAADLETVIQARPR